ncbi:MAG TPA: AAA family ATPase [Thermoanaerobaculia bacterium]
MEAVLFIGIQGSGKSSFYRERFFDTHVRISLDMLKTRDRERALVRACLSCRQPFVIDDTNVLASQRADWIALAREGGFRVTGYFFRSELKAALWRNNQREGKRKIPPGGLIGTYKRLQPPSAAEGFDELYIVEIDVDGKFQVMAPAV